MKWIFWLAVLLVFYAGSIGPAEYYRLKGKLDFDKPMLEHPFYQPLRKLAVWGNSEQRLFDYCAQWSTWAEKPETIPAQNTPWFPGKPGD